MQINGSVLHYLSIIGYMGECVLITNKRSKVRSIFHGVFTRLSLFISFLWEGENDDAESSTKTEWPEGVYSNYANDVWISYGWICNNSFAAGSQKVA